MIRLVKASDIITLMERYLSEKKFQNLDALYLWSKGVVPSTITSVLMNRYRSETAYTSLVNDLSDLKITSQNDNTEDTKAPVNATIQDIFQSKCKEDFLDQIRENLKVINPHAKMLLLVLIRSGLFMKGDVNLDELRLSYRTLFNETPSDYLLNARLRHLEQLGILYGERTFYRTEIERVKIPSYVYDLLAEIESKLPNVSITE